MVKGKARDSQGVGVSNRQGPDALSGEALGYVCGGRFGQGEYSKRGLDAARVHPILES